MPSHQICLSEAGFHFCRYPVDVLNYYPQTDAIYAKIRANGTIIEGYDKCVTSHITIVQFVSIDTLYQTMPDHIIRDDGSQEWYRNGKLHRENGPAVICHNHKVFKWYQDGYLHRIDGPAIQWNDRDEEWWRDGKRLGQSQSQP